MKWFIHALKNTFNYQGRARRAEFGWFYLSNFLIQIGVLVLLWGAVVALSLGTLNSETGQSAAVKWIGGGVAIFYVVFSLFQFVMWLTTISLTARRLHDLGWSGWWQLLLYLSPLLIMLPFIGILAANPGSPDFSQTEQSYFVMIFGAMMLYVLAAFIIMCLLCFKDGQRGRNKYGEDPKAEEWGVYAEKLQATQQKAHSPVIVSK